MHTLKDVEDGNYNPALYIKSKFKFGPATKKIEEEISNFKTTTKNQIIYLQKRHFKQPRCNLSPLQMNLIQFLKDNNEYIVVQGDKNLGPCILERVYYIYKAFEEHLGNERNYRQLSLTAAQGRQRGLQYMLRDWISKCKPCLPHEKLTKYVCISNAEHIFLSRALKHYPDKLAWFRKMCKVHKSPWKRDLLFVAQEIL